MSFLGVFVGAGFASGQEAMQYFVAFGNYGIAGVLLSAALMTITGVALLQFGSYFQAQDHMAVLSRIAGPTVARLLDLGTVITLFAIGFVMFAGAGSNLNQQYDLPLWVGATLLLVLISITGLLDISKVTNIIGMFTPLVILFIVGAVLYTLFTTSPDFSALDSYATSEVTTTLPNWWISALNYTGMNVMTAVSMTILIGGAVWDTRTAGWGGLIGGFFYLLMLFLLAIGLFIEVETVNGDDMPILTLITEINPWLGIAMSLVILAMIYNTGLGMFYALGRRLTRYNPARFPVVFISFAVLGYILSFVGFQNAISFVYPILGYLGIFMIITVGIAWWRGRSRITEEGERRVEARRLVVENDGAGIDELAADSNLDETEFHEGLEQDTER